MEYVGAKKRMSLYRTGMLSCFPFVHRTSSFSKGRGLSCFCRTRGCYRLGNLRGYNRAGAARRPIACTVYQYRPLNATHSATFQSEHDHTPVLGVPFSASSGHCVLLINLWVVVNHLEELILQTLVPASTFLHALGTLAPGEIGAILRRMSGARAGHSSWGPRGRRGPRRCAMCTVRRSRLQRYLVEDTPDAESRKVVTLRDFNQLAIRRRGVSEAGRLDFNPGSGDHDEEQSVWVVADATALEATGLFGGR